MLLSVNDHFGALPVSFWGKFFFFWVRFKHFLMGFYNNGFVVNLTTITLGVNEGCPLLLYITLFLKNHSVFPLQILYNRISYSSNNHYTSFCFTISILQGIWESIFGYISLFLDKNLRFPGDYLEILLALLKLNVLLFLENCLIFFFLKFCLYILNITVKNDKKAMQFHCLVKINLFAITF